MARLGNSEIPVLRVGAQAVCLEILIAMMADRDPLFGPRLLERNGGAGFRLAMFRFDGLSRGGSGGAFTSRRFLLRDAAGRGSRFRLLPGHLAASLISARPFAGSTNQVRLVAPTSGGNEVRR